MGKSKELAELGDVVTQSGGNVGIGTSSPTTQDVSANNLVVEDGAGNGGITIKTPSNAYGSLHFSDGTGVDAYRGILAYNHSDNNMQFHTNATERMRIDASGRVTMPYQPSFWAYYSGSNPSYNGDHTLNYDATIFNIGNCYNTANWRFTAPVDGIYLFTVNLNVYNVDAGNLWRAIFYKNGTLIKLGSYLISDSTNDQTHDTTIIVNMTAGDYVYVNVSSNDSSYSLSAGSAWNSFMGYLLG